MNSAIRATTISQSNEGVLGEYTSVRNSRPSGHPTQQTGVMFTLLIVGVFFMIALVIIMYTRNRGNYSQDRGG